MKKIRGVIVASMLAVLALASAPSSANPLRVQIQCAIGCTGSWRLSSLPNFATVRSDRFSADIFRSYDRTFNVAAGDYLWRISGLALPYASWSLSLNGTRFYSNSFSANIRDFRFRFTDREVFSVPEPGTLGLLAMGLFGIGVAARRRRGAVEE